MLHLKSTSLKLWELKNNYLTASVAFLSSLYQTFSKATGIQTIFEAIWEEPQGQLPDQVLTSNHGDQWNLLPWKNVLNKKGPEWGQYLSRDKGVNPMISRTKESGWVGLAGKARWPAILWVDCSTWQELFWETWDGTFILKFGRSSETKGNTGRRRGDKGNPGALWNS